MTKIDRIHINSARTNEWIDITPDVRRIISESGVKEGIAVVYVVHTTASVTVNENVDPHVSRDIMLALNAISPDRKEFGHREGNSAAHTLATLLGPSITLLVSGGAPILGTYQGIWFIEFDGPQARDVYVRVLGE